MTSRKRASDTIGTSTTGADRSLRAPTLSRRLALAALASAALAWLSGPPGRWLAILPLLLFGPGYLIESALRPFPRPSLWLRPTIWLGLSLSAIALLYEWATALGLSLTPLILDILAVGCGIAVFWRVWRIDQRPRTNDQRSEADAKAARWSLAVGPWWWALLAIFTLALGVRLYQIRDLALPAWVDSIHHALLIRVAAERGQAPLSLRPYMPIDQIPYHWGYHVFVAAAMQLSGVALPQAMLWSGQALNALHVLTVAGLAACLWRRPIAGVAAGVVVGLLSIWPAYYVSWGRYTQLAGLLLLPPLMIAWLRLLRAPSRGLAAVLALLLAGMSLIHFIVLIMALCFMAVGAAAWLFRAGGATLWPRAVYAAGGALAALALAAPWLWNLLARALTPAAGRAQPVTSGGSSYFALDQGLLWAGLNRWLIAIALLAALWALWRRWSAAAELIGWIGVLFVLANPWLALYFLPAAGASLLAWGAPRRRLALLAGLALLLLNPWTVRLPYIAIFTNEVVVISLFIPIAALIGGGAGLLWDTPANGERKRLSYARRSEVAGRWSYGRTAIVAALAVLSLWGVWNGRDVLNPSTVFARPADLAAITWVAEHTPADARFLINAQPWLLTGRGADGGWWLLPLAGRWTSTPPAIYDLGPPDYVRETRANTQIVMRFQPGQERQIYDLIDRERISYVYLGPNPAPLTPERFPASAGFAKVYDRDGVIILAVHR